MSSYIPLHLHSHIGSVLDSMVRVELSKGKNDLMEKCKEYGIESVALTDHGSMAGVVTHYKTCKEYGIKPIIGFEAYITSDYSIKDKTSTYYHLILLAKNNVGYRNLKELSSFGYTKGFYSKPRIDFNVLKEHSEGLVVLTACLASELDRLIMSDNYDELQAIELINKYKAVFGDDYYLEIQSSDSEEQTIVNKELVRLSKTQGIPLVVTTDVHFLTKEDFNAHNVYININQDRDTENYKYCYLQSRQEILDTLSYLDKDIVNQALDNTYVVADKCNVEIDLGHAYLPHLEVPELYNDEYDWLVSVVKQGLRKRGILKLPNKQEYLDRVKFELNVIKTKGFEGYFLILMEIISRAKAKGIPIGEGRGSAAGSIVAYLMGITNVDSVKYDLDFGRFLTVERTSLPDIDTDVSTARRGDLIDLVTEMFGVENVAQVATFGTLATKAVIDAVGKVMGIDKEDKELLKSKVNESVGTKSLVDLKEYKDYKDYIDTCIKIEGANRSYGCHAGALCISGNGKPMIDYAPVMFNKDGKIMTQFEMHDVEDVGLVKYDCLGLTSLDYIADTLKLIGSDYYSFEFDYEDQDVFDMIGRGENTAVFQADSNFAARVLTSVKPSNINELADCVSLGRPDAIQFLKPYVNAKFGHDEQVEIHKDLTKILSRTHGCLIYQEQMMNIFKVFGGFTDGESDKVRKIIGKKRLEDLPQQIEKFKEGAINRGYSNEVINKLVEFIEDNISYSFNMAHAVSYAITTYKTAYLKYHYPVEFMTAVINNQRNDNGTTDFDSVKAYIKASGDMGIKVVGVDINNSDRKFTPNSEDSSIYYGFELVKGLTENGINIIMNNRPFNTYKDFIDKVGLLLSKSDVIALIKSGSFNNICTCTKEQMFKYFFKVRFDAKKEDLKPISKANKNHIKWLYDNGYIGDEHLEDKEYCTKLISKVRLKQGWQDFKNKYMQGSELDWEMETLNSYISADPFEGVVIPSWAKVELNQVGYIGGVVVSVKETTVKNGKSKGAKMAFINVSYENGIADIVVFNRQYLEYKDLLKTGKCIVCKVEKQGDDKGILKSCITLEEYLEQTAQLQKGGRKIEKY